MGKTKQSYEIWRLKLLSLLVMMKLKLFLVRLP